MDNVQDYEVRLTENVLKSNYKTLTDAQLRRISENLERLNVIHKWNKTKGAGVKIGIIDTGVDINHVDLRHCIQRAYNAFNGSTDVRDVQGHGTHVAGVLAGDGIMKGVAPESKLYVAKGLGDNGSGTINSLIQSLNWCINQNVDIITMSLGINVPIPIMETAINYATSRGIICVAAAGNDGYGRHDVISIDYPAAYENTIAVGAIDMNRKSAYFSSIGNVDVVTFGVDVISTFPNNRYAALSGTSMATPYITGAIALIQSNAKNRLGRRLTLEEIRMMLILNAVDLGEPGYDNVYGYGKFQF